MKYSHYDIIVIGAGPSGLAAIDGIKGNHKTLIIDQGMKAEKRKHTTADHLGYGIGGAGLFSDGKFSYYPAGTAVYQLDKEQIIKEAHHWVETKMSNHKIQHANFEEFNLQQTNASISRNIIEKKYPSYYATLQQRRALMDEISSIQSKAEIVTKASITGLEKVGNSYTLEISLLETGESFSIKTDKIVLATGRFGAKDLKEIVKGKMEVPFKYIRAEFGIRIESPSDIGFLSRKKNPDVKFIWKSEFGEIRTFCTCREGEIWNIPYCNGLSALSGRSDGPQSGYSNFGLLVRINQPSSSLGNQILDRVLNNEAIKNNNAIFQSLPSFMKNKDDSSEIIEMKEDRPWFPKQNFKLGNIRQLLGEQCSELLLEAINSLLEQSPDLYNEKTMMVFPSIEGVGEYLKVDNNLKVINENIWVCGDCSGSFRGLIPAFISGYYAGHECSN